MKTLGRIVTAIVIALVIRHAIYSRTPGYDTLTDPGYQDMKQAEAAHEQMAEALTRALGHAPSDEMVDRALDNQ